MMEILTIDNSYIDDLLSQFDHACREAKPGTLFDEFSLTVRRSDGRLEIKTGRVPRGFRPQNLKKAKKKTTTTRRPRHVRR